ADSEGDSVAGGERPCVERAARAELQLGTALRALRRRERRAHGRFIGGAAPRLERERAMFPAKRKHRAGCAFVHRPRRLSASALAGYRVRLTGTTSTYSRPVLGARTTL